MTMRTLRYRVTFSTPAFLGDANQSGQWRTPPFKASLRHWWRMAWSAEHAHRGDVRSMRDQEAELFGSATAEHTTQSRVRFRLDEWRAGKLDSAGWAQGRRVAKVGHPQVQQQQGKVSPLLYLGYGPLQSDRERDEKLAKDAAIDAGESALLGIGLDRRVSERDERLIRKALALAHRFGTIGGRSRNGWGSFQLEPEDGTPPLDGEAIGSCLRKWSEALDRDWPHAIGSDEHGPLIWQTRPEADWRLVMRTLAETRIAIRTHSPIAFRSTSKQPLHWMAYPAGRSHALREWDRAGARLPNSLRFKVQALPDGRMRGLIFHVPICPPEPMTPSPTERADLLDLWNHTRQLLDQPKTNLQRVVA